MFESQTRKRRTFLASVGAAITGGIWSRTASAKTSAGAGVNRTSIPYKPEVLVVGGGPAGIGAALSVRKKCMSRALSVRQLQAALRADEVDLDRGGNEQADLVNQG